MAISTPEEPRDRRFQLRATASEETLIKVAAERQGVNVTDFIMRSACESAEQALSDQTRFVLDEKQWKEFMAALDRPPKDKPRLRPQTRESRANRKGARQSSDRHRTLGSIGSGQQATGEGTRQSAVV